MSYSLVHMKIVKEYCTLKISNDRTVSNEQAAGTVYLQMGLIIGKRSSLKNFELEFVGIA